MLLFAVVFLGSCRNHIDFPAQVNWYRVNKVTGAPDHIGMGNQYRVDEADYTIAGEYFCTAEICDGGERSLDLVGVCRGQSPIR